MNKVAIIIPNWNGQKWLRPCLDSLQQSTFTDWKCIVIDNASEDESLQLLRSDYPWVKIIENKKIEDSPWL